MWKLLSLSTVLVNLILAESAVLTKSTTCPRNVNVTEARDRLNLGNTAFTGELLYQLVSNKPEENIVISGWSVQVLLAQLAIFSLGRTSEQLIKLFKVEIDEIKAIFPVMIKEYTNSNQLNAELRIITKNYGSNLNPLSNHFKRYTKEYFYAKEENVNFRKWVANRTHDNIVDLIKMDTPNANTRLVLLNAINFKGDWKYQFNSYNTKTKNFYKSNGDTVPVKMMYQQNYFNYAENDNYQVLGMLYKNEKFNFIVVLPKTTYNLLDIAKIFKDPKAYREMVGSLRNKKVKVSLPKYLISSQFDVVESLKELNITYIRTPNNNEIKGILKKPERLFISKATQQGFISVDEVGSKAGVNTGFVGSATSSVNFNPAKIIFNADHPFIFFISYNKNPLFCGAFVGPQ